MAQLYVVKQIAWVAGLCGGGNVQGIQVLAARVDGLPVNRAENWLAVWTNVHVRGVRSAERSQLACEKEGRPGCDSGGRG